MATLPTPAEIASLNTRVTALVGQHDGGALRGLFENNTLPFLFLTPDNAAGSLPLIAAAVGRRAQLLAPNWLPSDLVQLSPSGMELFLEQHGLRPDQVESVMQRRAAMQRALGRSGAFVEDPAAWRRLARQRRLS